MSVPGRIDLDCRGQLCPLPVVALARAAASARPGTVVVLLADDPAARTDVAAWCRMRGQHLVARTDDPDGPGSTYEVRLVG